MSMNRVLLYLFVCLPQLKVCNFVFISELVGLFHGLELFIKSFSIPMEKINWGNKLPLSRSLNIWMITVVL